MYAKLAIAHLVLRLRPIQRALRVASARRAELADRVLAPDGEPPCVTYDDVNALLDDVDDLVEHQGISAGESELDDDERAAEDELRARAAELGMPLPLDRLVNALMIDAFEEESLLLCIAPEVDPAFGTIYGFVLDDLTRRAASMELAVSLTASSFTEKIERRRALGRWGKLRRLGLLVAGNDQSGELRQELRVTAAARHLLFGGVAEPRGLFSDPAEVAIPVDGALPSGLDLIELHRLAAGLARREVLSAGVFGPRTADVAGAVVALAAAAELPLRRLLSLEPSMVRDSVEAAALMGTGLWIDGDLFDGSPPGALETLDHALAADRVPLLFSGSTPLRPQRILESHAYAELRLTAPGHAESRAAWLAQVPELEDDDASRLAARFRLGEHQLRAVAAVARTRARLVSDGHAAPITEQLDQACEIVTRRRSYTFATVVTPRRTDADLVLPDEMKHRVMQIVSFFRSLPTVEEEWGLARLGTGSGGIKALFSGESGTGKTLAAEVVAGMLGLPLMRVDLARIVSKWVGETEKNLDVAFREAQESQAVLFFDEADALFGNRAEVRQGTDRYANLEVSYLLQRLEDHGGLVILASNLRDHIDAAFTRRFHVVVGFPRPALAERKRLWALAFGKIAPLGPDVDFNALARLDMTGASIVGSARTAALLAADAGASSISMTHVVHAAAQQYHREARVLPLSELGTHAALLRGSA